MKILSDCKVLTFKPRPPSEAELEVYEQMTRNWAPQMKQLIFPKHFAQQAKAKSRPNE
jgi:hypothetical protein